MPCSNRTGEYLSYNCYDTLNILFGKSQLSDDGEKFFNKTTEQFKEVSQFIKENNNILNDLARFLTADNVFVKPWYHMCCMYINFWLNEQVKNSYNDKYSSKFHIFANFAKTFAEERGSDGYPKNTCENYIKKIDGEKYHKKKILYNLYDLYTEHKTHLHDGNREQLCNNINIIVKGSHDAKDHIKQDKDFAKRLKELKDLIKKKKPHDGKCNNYNILENMLPKDDPMPRVETPVMTAHNSLVTDPLPKSPNQDLEHRVGDMSRNVQTVLSENEKLPQKSELQVATNTAMAPLQNIQEKPAHTETQERYLLHNTRSHEDPIDNRRSHVDTLDNGRSHIDALDNGRSHIDALDNTVLQGVSLHETFPEVDRLDTTLPQAARFLEQDTESPPKKYQLLEDTQDISSQTGGVLGSIQNTITEVLGSVEPAPVLGVSGGMGALFLLFKYTPVGTFFRGRRGRTHGIPSGFHGPFPGGFPVYDDYYGGNFGNDRFHISYQAE
ncbi:VIR protein [Plasmodium vivax]|uniref:VIR protein n=1 Tax=Plasmodium vivax TaxID=5855 RepID=A0A1G4E2P2_PLAVI|nr:VIR protein [Plasmodium vivax]